MVNKVLNRVPSSDLLNDSLGASKESYLTGRGKALPLHCLSEESHLLAKESSSQPKQAGKRMAIQKEAISDNPSIEELQRQYLKIGIAATGCIVLLTGVFIAWNQRNYLWHVLTGQGTNADEVFQRTENCVQHFFGTGLLGMCCARNVPGASSFCRMQQKCWIDEQLRERPNAWFQWRNEDLSLPPSFAQINIRGDLDTLHQMATSDPSRPALLELIAQKLFVDLPNYCKTKEIPQDMRFNGEPLNDQFFLLQELDSLYDSSTGRKLLTQESLDSIVGAFNMPNPNDSADLILKCLQKKIGSWKSCLWG